MEDSIDFIDTWLKDKSSKILTILGMAGIGKTSLAEYVYKFSYNEFERSSFVKEIGRKCAQKPGALLDLQQQLLRDVIRKSMIQVHDVNTGTAKIENALLNKQTLLVLDDIDNFEQLDVLIGTKGFHPGTKIIITTKDGSVTEKCALLFRKTFPTKHAKHNLSGLSDAESLRLLCWHAFGTSDPKEGYEVEAKRIATYCGGHPLALKVLGGSLINEDVDTWSDLFERFETKEVYNKIQKVLQISFYMLPSRDCQELFKHIACFFVGKDREITETILKKCDIRASNGIEKLTERCLLTIGSKNELQMHQLVQEMGRDLVRQESPKKPWKRSRLWNHNESLKLLIEDKGSSKVRGLILDMMMLEEEPLPSSSYKTKHKSKDVVDKKFSALSIILVLYELFSVIWRIFARFFLMFSSPHCKTIEWKTDALAKMDKLVLLQLNHVKLNGSYKNFPRGLRWLCMHGFRLKYIPSELPIENLVALDMSYSDLERLWKKPVLLGSLKILNLSHCIKLVRVDGFSGLPSLERLILERCASLISVSDSIGQCAGLLYLDMSYCNKLRKLPSSIRKLKKVRILSINGCIGIHELPNEMKDMESLAVLKADDLGLKSHVSRIPKIVTQLFPSSIVSLKDNNLSNESFPIDDFGSLIMLKKLYLDNNPIDSLPSFVRSLSKLDVLSLDKCSTLKSIIRPPMTINHLSVMDCSSLMEITFHEEMSSPPYVSYRGVESLKEIPEIFKIQDLAQVDDAILRCLGWKNLECVKDQELSIRCDMLWGDDAKKLPVQMIYEFGIFSACFRGKELPDWLGGHRSSSNEPSITLSYTMPSTPVNKKFKGFNIASVHAFTDKQKHDNITTLIVNETKKYLIWEYQSRFSLRECDAEVVRLSHWMFGENEFADGDEVTVKIHDFSRNVIIKECAISPVYSERSDMDGEEKDDPLAYYKSWKYIVGGDLSPFEKFFPGYYDLSGFLYFLHYLIDIQGFSKIKNLALEGLQSVLNG